MDYKDQQAEIRRMKADILREKESAAYNERQASSIRIGGPEMKIKGMKDHVQGIAKKVAKKAKARETKLERYLDSDERVEKPGQNWEMGIEFQDAGESGRDVLVLEHLSAGYGGLVLLEDISLRLRFGRRVLFHRRQRQRQNHAAEDHSRRTGAAFWKSAAGSTGEDRLHRARSIKNWRGWATPWS